MLMMDLDLDLRGLHRGEDVGGDWFHGGRRYYGREGGKEMVIGHVTLLSWLVKKTKKKYMIILIKQYSIRE